jgi:hypothetical protein
MASADTTTTASQTALPTHHQASQDDQSKLPFPHMVKTGAGRILVALLAM